MTLLVLVVDVGRQTSVGGEGFRRPSGVQERGTEPAAHSVSTEKRVNPRIAAVLGDTELITGSVWSQAP